MQHRPLLLVPLLFLAGCTGPALIDEPQTPLDESPPDSTESEATGASTATANGIAVAPRWQIGDWWTFRIGSSFAAAREITVIVVGADEMSYALGAADEQTALEPVWWHLPPIGIVSAEDLGWEAHDAPMSLIQFPIHDGAEWSGAVEGIPADFTARRLPSGAFEVVGMEEDRLAIQYVYDPAIGQFTNASLSVGPDTFWSTMELVAHGKAWADGAFLPMFDDAFMGGWGEPDPEGGPKDFEVPQDVTHVMIGCLSEGIVGDLRAQIIPSEGDAFSCGETFTSPGSAMHIVHGPGAPGTWRIVPTVAGIGTVFIEASNVWLLTCDPADASLASGLLLKPHTSCTMP